MKQFMKEIGKYKLMLAIIFIGEIVLFMLSKAIVERVYSMDFLTVLYLGILALAVTTILYIFNIEKMTKKLKRPLLITLQFLKIVAIVFLANLLFKFYILDGISYLYFILFVSGSYWGGVLGMYIMDKFDVDGLNKSIVKFNSIQP